MCFKVLKLLEGNIRSSFIYRQRWVDRDLIPEVAKVTSVKRQVYTSAVERYNQSNLLHFKSVASSSHLLTK